MKQSFKNNDTEAERREVLVAAASILRQDACTQICETKYYTPSTCLFDNLNESIPESIIFFVDELIGRWLKEVLSVIFAQNSVDHILSGHAYSRAIRGHTLLQLAQAHIILNALSLNYEQKELLNICLSNLSDFQTVEDSSAVKELKKIFDEKMKEIKNRGPTAQLWIQ